MAGDEVSQKARTTERIKARRKADKPGLEELEKRVLLAELHAREAEAEVRYLEAAAKRKSLRSGKKGTKSKRRSKSE